VSAGYKLKFLKLSVILNSVKDWQMEYKLLEWTDDKVKRFWDYISQFPEHYFTYQVGGNLAKLIKKYTRENVTLLDYGSGPGFLIKYLLENNIEVSALEFSPDSLRRIKASYEGQKGFMGAYSIEDLNRKNIRFDVITLIEVIEHLDDRYLDMTFDNIHRLLKPDGYLIITTPNDEDLSKSYICCPETNELFHRWQHIRSWNTVTLGKFIENKGYKIHVLKGTNFNISPISERLHYPINVLKELIRGKSVRKDLPHLYCICSPNVK
jgi:2-polyprenyl-3-methyl-5-hydroxy-6-metoxy-1,4-benzoquinol methylase